MPKYTCQAYRGMDTYKKPVIVEAANSSEAAQKAMTLVPFGDTMQCTLATLEKNREPKNSGETD